MLLILPLKASDVNRDNGSVKSPKIRRNKMCLKAVDVRVIDKVNEISDSATVNTQGKHEDTVIVCFRP